LIDVLEDRYAACVIVQNRHNFTKEGTYQASIGCGVIVEEGQFVLTAGHPFDLPEVEDAKAKIILTTGKVIDAELLHPEIKENRSTNLSILKINSEALSAPSVEMAETHPSEIVFTLSYPEFFGHDGKGAVLECLLYKDKANYLEPLVQVGTVESVSNKITIVPFAGSSALEGMSDAPVIEDEE